MQLKRLWDTTTKQIVFVEGPTGHQCQLWVDESTDKMYYYDMSQWIEYTQSAAADGRTYGPTWKVVDSDDEMGVYDTNEPTELFAWESGDKVSYVFKDWDGTVLKEGKVKEGTKPTAPADPTRAATAQYTYTFAGWNPTVAKITKKTTYTATYTATVNEYTVSIAPNDVSYGTVDENSLTVDYGTAISAEGNVLTVGEESITATAEEGYQFVSWGTLPATVTENVSITATFEAIPATDVTITATSTPSEVGSFTPNENYGEVTENGATLEIPSGSIIYADGSIIDLGNFGAVEPENLLSVEPVGEYNFIKWTLGGEDVQEETDIEISSDSALVAVFEAV